MNGIYTMASPSSSSLYGNVGCAIRELILSKFPYNFFNYTNISTEMAFHNMRRQFGSNSNAEIYKRKKPHLIIQPSYQVRDEDDFLQGIPLTKNYMDIQNSLDRRYLFEAINDDEHNWALKFKINRDRIDYDVTINVSTLHNQLDVYKAMVNQITWENPMYYPAALEAVLPKSMITYMSRLCNMDIHTYPEFIPMFLRHLNSVSSYPITYKVRNASATDEFFMYYQHNLVTTFTDLQIESGNKKGMVDDYYSITFRVSVEFNLPGLFILQGTSPVVNQIDVGIISKNSSTNDFDDEKDDYVPLFSLSNFYNKFPQRKDGLTLYGSFMFTTDEKSASDTADIGLLIEPEHQKAIRFHTKFGMLEETICKVYVLKNREELSPDEFKINWDTMKIEYSKPDPSATYRVAIYMNMEVINADLANPRISESYDQSSLVDNYIDYSKAKNQKVFNFDDPNQDTDFTASSADGSILDRPLPGVFRGEDLDTSRVDRANDMVAVPTSREHEDMWHRMDTVPRDNKFEGDMKLTPSDHRDENSFHLMAQEVKDTSIYNDVELTPSDHRDENAFHLMSQEVKNLNIYSDVESTPSDHRDENSFHLMAQEVKDVDIYDNATGNKKTFNANNVSITKDANGNIMASGVVDLSSLIKISSPNKKKITEPTDEVDDNQKENESTPQKKEIIMKYYSSIFDTPTSVNAKKETPVKKYKWSSSTEDQEIEEKITFIDSLDPVHIDALNTWSKIIGNAMLYNYATKIAIEDNNNYVLNTNGELVHPEINSRTKHMCTCGCEDEESCTCGWKDRLNK